jgi:hypothetical protein
MNGVKNVKLNIYERERNNFFFSRHAIMQLVFLKNFIFIIMQNKFIENHIIYTVHNKLRKPNGEFSFIIYTALELFLQYIGKLKNESSKKEMKHTIDKLEY